MRIDCVVDVGNSAIKWGLVRAGAVQKIIRLDLTNQQNWLQNYEELRDSTQGRRLSWAVAGSNADVRDEHTHFLSRLGAEQISVIKSFRQIPIGLDVQYPERVGLDRLLNGVAVNSHRSKDQPAIIVDAGSAVTVDLVDAAGVFQGGAILPGLRLMGKALHDHVAHLPDVQIQGRLDPPGKFTEEAIAGGIFHAVAGGIASLVRSYQARFECSTSTFLGGGDGHLFERYLGDLQSLPDRPGSYEGRSSKLVLWPVMTLEGIRLSAEHA